MEELDLSTPTPPNRQKRLMLIVIVIIALLVVVAALSVYASRKRKQNTTSSQPQTTRTEQQTAGQDDQPYDYEAVVSMETGGTVPAVLTVKPKTRVVFENHDTKPHGVVANPERDGSVPDFGQATIEPNDGYAHTFTASGHYKYHDPYDPARNGEIVVE